MLLLFVSTPRGSYKILLNVLLWLSPTLITYIMLGLEMPAGTTKRFEAGIALLRWPICGHSYLSQGQILRSWEQLHHLPVVSLSKNVTLQP